MVLQCSRMFSRQRKTTATESQQKTTAGKCRVVTELLDPNGADGDAIQSWRVFRIMSEFVQGFELLREHGLAATF